MGCVLGHSRPCSSKVAKTRFGDVKWGPPSDCTHEGFADLCWPGLDSELGQVAKASIQCQKERNAPAVASLHPWLWPARPWVRVHLDFAGPFQGQMFLIAVNAHSKWTEVVEMSTTTAAQTVAVLRQMLAANGLPEQLVSNKRASVCSEEFASFCKFNGIQHIRVSPYHPSSNGLAERLVQTFKVTMRKSEKNGLSFQHHLGSFLLLYRATPLGVTATTPCVVHGARLAHPFGLTVAMYP